ncbi:hypothetical protein KJ742_02850, partial [Patescibacteria group bacterium]|nr:hypothetical protein [Patescibacteria group bacterium]
GAEEEPNTNDAPASESQDPVNHPAYELTTFNLWKNPLDEELARIRVYHQVYQRHRDDSPEEPPLAPSIGEDDHPPAEDPVDQDDRPPPQEGGDVFWRVDVPHVGGQLAGLIEAPVDPLRLSQEDEPAEPAEHVEGCAP